MRRTPLILALSAALLIPEAARPTTISANFGVSVTPTQTIASVHLSNNRFSGGAASGTVVGAVSVAMSPASPAFSGTLALTGANAGSFQIVGSNLVTNGVDAAGTYGINIVASEVGTAGSAFAAPETITGIGAGNTTSACNDQTYTYNLVTSFGAVSGGSVATNNAALQAFNIEAQRRTRPAEPGYAGGANGAGNPYPGASRDNCIILTIPAGTYQYSWNHFAFNIAHLKIVGAGSDLTTANPTNMQNVNNDGWYVDEIAFQGPIDYFSGLFPPNNLGYFIDSTNVGDTSVRLSGSPSNARNFYVGRWVLVASYDQQFGGYPPNFRYYDWARVTSINTATGVIGLDTPLQFAHLSDRPYAGTLTDGPSGTIGPARIIPIDTPSHPVGVYQEYDGLHALANPNWTLGQTGPAAQPYDDCWRGTGLIDGSMNDIHDDEGECFIQDRNFTISNSKWQGDESDKIVGTLTFINDTVTLGSTSHAGELFWHVIGGHYGGNGAVYNGNFFQGRNMLIEGGTVIDAMLQNCSKYVAGVYLDAQEFQTIDVTINGVTFVGNGCTSNGPIVAPSILHQTIDGRVISVADGPNGPNTRLQVQRTGIATYNSVPYDIAVEWGDGDPIWKNGNWVTGAAVTSITGDANYVYVDVSGTTFATGDSVWAARVQKVTVENSVGRNTGYSWGAPNLRYPNGANSIPKLVWSNNSGN